MRCRRYQDLLIVLSLSGSGLCAMTLPRGMGSSDWSSITKEYQRHRHAAFPIAEGGYRARGWEQQWVTRFDGRGFEVIPDEGSWRWGLQLQSYGFPGAQRDVADQAKVSTDVERISYQWDARVEEWFVNSDRGLEQGFTITKRPPGAGPLLFHLAVRGNLHGEISGRGVRFVDRCGAAVLNYAGLLAIDSAGRELTARMTIEAGGLRIKVDENGARYPITIDPLVQQAYIKASNSREFLGFGASVAMDGDTVVVGTDNESSNATGVNGDQTNTSLAQAGAAYVFVRSGTTWSQQAYLKPINTQGGERFGHSVAISGDSIVVGAFWEGSITKGVNPDPTPVVPHPAPFSGAAYTFVRVAGLGSRRHISKRPTPRARLASATISAIPSPSPATSWPSARPMSRATRLASMAIKRTLCKDLRARCTCSNARRESGPRRLTSRGRSRRVSNSDRLSRLPATPSW